MSMDLAVYAEAARIPTRQQWQAVITKLGFPFTFDAEVDVTTMNGFLPCIYDGDMTGFECYYTGKARVVPAGSGLDLATAVMVTFSVQSETDFVSACIAAAVMAGMSDGVVVDQQDGANYKGEAALAWAREVAAHPPQPGQASDAAARLDTSGKPWWRFW